MTKNDQKLKIYDNFIKMQKMTKKMQKNAKFALFWHFFRGAQNFPGGSEKSENRGEKKCAKKRRQKFPVF